MPKGFQFLESYVGLWVPAALTPRSSEPGAHYLTVVARTKPGVREQRADADLAAVARRISQTSRTTRARCAPTLCPSREQLVGDARRPLLLCPGGRRRPRDHLRQPRGAPPGPRARGSRDRGSHGPGREPRRIVRQLLTESVLLSVLGMLPGFLVAAWTFSFLEHLIPPGPGAFGASHPRRAGPLCALALSLATGLLFGLAPALQTRGST